MEPNSNFALIVTNAENEVSGFIKDQPAFVGGSSKDAFTFTNGGIANAVILRPVAVSLTPAHPLRLVLAKTGETDTGLLDVLHQKGENAWVPVPVAQFRPT